MYGYQKASFSFTVIFSTWPYVDTNRLLLEYTAIEFNHASHAVIHYSLLFNI